MKKQSDSNDAQTPYDETTEVFAVEEPLDETVEIDEQVDLTSTTQMPATDAATAPVDMNAPLYAQFAGDTDEDSGLGNDGGNDDVEAIVNSAESGGEPVDDDLTIPMQVTDASHHTNTGEEGPQNIPLYQAPPQRKPEPERPKGASAGTIVFGVVVLLFGALTVTVGLLMNSSMFSFVEFNRITGYLFAGLGILLSLIAIVMGISSHWRNKNRSA